MHFNDPGRIKVFLQDPNKKSLIKICKEVLVLWMTRKEFPMYYFKHLYKKDVINYRDYLGTALNNRIHKSPRLHQQEFISILSNKLNFSLYCEKNGLPTPKLIGHNFGRQFFSENGTKEISTLEQLIQFYEGTFRSSNLNAIFFRPLSLYGGQGCFKLDEENFAKQLEAEHKNLIQGNYAHTEVIAQHSEIGAIFGKSINTLRILTHFDDGKVNIITSYIRFGTGESVVDNGSSGGLSIGIHLESGTLKRWSYTDLKFGGGKQEAHPDTGIQFNGFKIPYFEEACALAKTAAMLIPNGLIGWDIALTPSGPIIIEGNENPSLFVTDIVDEGLLKNSRMQKVIARL